MKFTEAQLEKAFTELLGNEQFPHHLGETISRATDEVLIEEDLQKFLLKQYEAEGLTVTEAKSIILQLKSLPSSDLYESNKTFIKMLSDGFILKREDRNQKDIYIQLIDYKGLNKHKQPEAEQVISIVAEDGEIYGKDNNIYKFVTQLEISNHPVKYTYTSSVNHQGYTSSGFQRCGNNSSTLLIGCSGRRIKTSRSHS